MMLTTKLSRPVIRWAFKGVEFHFDDPRRLSEWAENPRVHFELDAKNADDDGRAVFERPEFFNSCHYEVTPEFADVEIELSETSVFISADVPVLLPVRKDLDEETLEHWFDELAGSFAATITVDDDEAWWGDRGTWVYLSHND